MIGAGIIGLSVAMELQRGGHRVTVIDHDEPMSGCSSGNAGYLSEANIFPPAAPDMLVQLPKLLLARDGPLVIKPAYMPRMVSWGRHALAAVKERRRRVITETLARLTLQAYEATASLAARAGASHLLSRDGGLVVFNSPHALEKKCESLATWRRYGISVDRLSGPEVCALEPALLPSIAGGLYFRNSGRCSNPRRLGLVYAEHVLRNGGRITKESIRSLDTTPAGEAVLHGAGGEMRFRRVVVCAGFWSGKLLQPYFGRVPLASERGYHLMLPTPGVRVNRPIVFGEPHFAATPMEEGLRLAGTAEFAAPEAPANFGRAMALQEELNAMFKRAGAAGLATDIVGGGSYTFPYWANHTQARVSPGSWVYSNSQHQADQPHRGWKVGAYVLSTVLSERGGTLTLDVGSKAISPDIPMEKRFIGVTKIVRMNEEHTTAIAPALAPGDRVALVPRHTCTTAYLYRRALVLTKSGQWEYRDQLGCER